MEDQKTNPRRVDVCAVGCEAEMLDSDLKRLNAEGWNIRQIYQEPLNRYRIFAQKRLTAPLGNQDGMGEAAVKLIKDNPGLSLRKLQAHLKENGISRGKDWIWNVRANLTE